MTMALVYEVLHSVIADDILDLFGNGTPVAFTCRIDTYQNGLNDGIGASNNAAPGIQ